MRPISLSLAGLHSFRKTQTIDFTQVSDAGVFGVFGPTGSGKSTILDAITLALFGNVERSDKNRVGIINQQEDKIHVKLNFELNDKTYTVERVYARNGELRVKSTLARLYVVENGEEIALADKENDVTKSVESLLGLEVKDFTRAVILPQGKFAEFLTLKSQERRPMLERLFHLNDYGKKLKDRAQAKENSLKKDRDEVIAKQEMLKHASKEKLEEEIGNLKQIKAEKKAKEDEIEAFLHSFHQIEEKWKQTQKLQEIQNQLALLKEKELAIQLLEQKREKAEKASKLENLIQNNERLDAKLAELKKIIAQLTAQHENISVQENSEKQLFAQAKSALEQKGPELTNQLFQLKEAVIWEEEIKQLEQEILTLQEKSIQLEEELKNNTFNSEKNKEQLESANGKYNQLKIEIQNIFVSAEERNKLEKAWEILNQLTDQQKLMEERLSERDKIQNILDQKEIQLSAGENDLKKLQNSLQDIELQQELTNRFAPISQEDWHIQDKQLLETESNIEKIIMLDQEINDSQIEKTGIVQKIQELTLSFEETEKLLIEKDQQLQKIAKQKEHLQRNNVIGHLVKELESGMPCLVCGSTHHPYSNTNQHEFATQEHSQQFEEESKQVNEDRSLLLVEKSALATKLEGLVEQLNSLDKKVIEKQTIIEERMNSLPTNYQQLPISQLKGKFNQEKEEHQQLQAKIATYLSEQEQENQQILAINEQIQKIMSGLQVIKSENTLYLERKKEIEVLVEHGQRKIEEYNKQREDDKENWGFEALAKRREEVKYYDEQREGLEIERQALERNLQQLEVIKQKLSEAIQQQKVEREYLESSLKERKLRVDGLKQKLELITDGKLAKEVLMETEQKLEEIKNQAILHEEKWKKINEQLMILDKQVATENAVYNNVLAQLNDSNLELADKLNQEQWENIAEVKIAMIRAEELAQMIEEIKNYYNQKLYYLEQEKEIQASLEGAKITEMEWNKILLEKEEKIQAIEEIKLAVSKKTYEVEQLDKDYLEWNRLETKRKEVQHELDIASELNKVLKGNVLVDFVAQEYLRNITTIASDKLLQLTRNRYSLGIDEESGFTIIDHTNAGLTRPVQSLSGGETFITSLALALALSSQIQLKGGQPLQFFFLDEGFGTLDGDLLDTVMMTLEKLQSQHMTIGIISHVPELQNRLHRKIVVVPPDVKGNGSMIKIES